MDFSDFVAAQGRSLVQAAFLLTGDLRDAEDLVQLALIRVLRRWDAVEHPVAYTRQTVVRLFLDAKRTRRRDPTLVATPLDEADAVPVPGADVRVGVSDVLWRGVCALPPRERAVVVLRYYEDLDDEEIAATLDVRPSTVRATASRAVARLRRLHVTEMQES